MQSALSESDTVMEMQSYSTYTQPQCHVTMETVMDTEDIQGTDAEPHLYLVAPFRVSQERTQ